MDASQQTLFALLGLLLTSLWLELTPQPQDEIITECCCWVVILLGGRIFFYYAPKTARPSKSAELSNITFAAVLLCLSYSFKPTLWVLAPLLCPAAILFEAGSQYLPLHVKPKQVQTGGQSAKRWIALVCAYAVVTTLVLSLSDPERSDFRLKICWLFAQIVLYWALSRRVDDVAEVEGDNLQEGLRTAIELAPYMLVTTIPVAILWWSELPLIQEISLIAVLKASRWISVFVLANETKISLLPWATVFAICTKAAWAFPIISQAGLAATGALVALSRTATAFPHSDRRRWLIIACALCPLWSLGLKQDLSPTLSSWKPWHSGETVTTESWDDSVHPIVRLTEEARARFDSMLSRQSQSLDEAVAEYRRRYGRSPPPGFDDWYHWAVRNDVQLIDEYDFMTRSFERFWQVPPSVLRDYVDQALFVHGVGKLEVKNHIAKLDDHPYFQHKQLVQLIDPIVHMLPDFKAPVNNEDEPRVLLPHDIAHGEALQSLDASYKESQKVLFTTQDRQNTWSSLTLPCPPDSRARAALIEPKANSLVPPFISNLTAAQDICTWPVSASQQHGFISSPSSFEYTHSLVPMLSTAKLSTFEDILMPSSYYFQGDIDEQSEDTDSVWEDKKGVVYWRGTATGGHWHGGSWRMGHRQRFVNFTNSASADVQLMREEIPGHWVPYKSHMGEVMKNFEVNFTRFIQCDEADCRAEEEYFGKAPRDNEKNSHQYKIVYNLDGNSFSGRYYRYLKSNSLVFMEALFKEWHDDRIIPWVHYVPISVSMEELPEAARYLLEDPTGQVVAKRIADDSREWARRILRPVDLTAAYFRSFLEYARLLNDERDSM